MSEIQSLFKPFFYSHKSTNSFINFFPWDCSKPNCCFKLIFLSQIQPEYQQYFALGLLDTQQLFQTFFLFPIQPQFQKLFALGLLETQPLFTFFLSQIQPQFQKLFALGLLEIQPLLHTFFPFTNLAIVSKIICTGIIGNPTVVSHLFSFHKSSHSFKNYLHRDSWKSNRCFTLFFYSQIQPQFQQYFALGLLEIPPIFHTFFPLTNLAIVSIFCTEIVGNPTDVSHFFSSHKSSHSFKNICTGIVGSPTLVSHFFSSHKSSHSFKNYLHWDCWKSNRCFKLFFLSQIYPYFQQYFALGLLEIQPMFHTFFILRNLAIVSTIFCTGILGNPTNVSHFFSSYKSTQSFNNIVHWDSWKSNRCFTLFFVSQIQPQFPKLFALGLLEIQPMFHTFFYSYKSSHSFNNILHWDCWNSNRCFTLFSSHKSRHSFNNILHQHC